MDQHTLDTIKASIKSIPDHPKPGIVFRDITSLVEDADAFAKTVKVLAERFKGQGIDKVVGAEARGFIFGAPVAAELGAGFVPARKPGKLPRATVAQSYSLEYGEDMLQIHADAILPGEKVLIVDDLLATGGTVEAAISLIRRLGGVVTDAAFVISLPDLGGEAKLKEHDINLFTIVEFEGE